MANNVTATPGPVRAQAMIDANEDLVAFVESCSDDDWGKTCQPERWPVGVVACHVARGHRVVAQWIEEMVGEGGVSLSPDELDEMNAAMAKEVAGVSRDEVIELSRRNVETLAATLRGLSDEDLRVTAPFGPSGGAVLPVDRLAGSRGHLDGHLASMREAVGR